MLILQQGDSNQKKICLVGARSMALQFCQTWMQLDFQYNCFYILKVFLKIFKIFYFLF
jgi:hypothetical protein